MLLTTGYAKVLVNQSGMSVLRKPYQIATLGRAVREAIDAARLARLDRAV